MEYKTELVSWLCLKGKLTPSSVHFSDHIEYFKTKKQKNKIKFVKDEKGGRGAGVGGEKRAVGKGAEDVFKKDKVTIGRGLPSTSQVFFSPPLFPFFLFPGSHSFTRSPNSAKKETQFNNSFRYFLFSFLFLFSFDFGFKKLIKN